MAICPYMSYIARIPILNYIPIYSVVTRARAREQPTTDDLSGPCKDTVPGSVPRRPQSMG
jgi:hypothetical protein